MLPFNNREVAGSLRARCTQFDGSQRFPYTGGHKTGTVIGLPAIRLPRIQEPSKMRVAHLLLGLLSLVVLASAEVAVGQAAAEKTEKKEAAPKPVAVENGTAELTPKNTTIQFVGTHKGPEPNPRTGFFSGFKGELMFDESTNAPTAADVEIETDSLITPIGRLTGHLRSPDFFDVRQFPKASFKSTKIEAVDAAAGKFRVTGDLTIRDVKKSITFPADVKVSENGAVLDSKFKIKRSEFGLSFGPDRIVEEVTMTVTVGKSTPKVKVE
jgi:polyisoprenoid-binding protein YceI